MNAVMRRTSVAALLAVAALVVAGCSPRQEARSGTEQVTVYEGARLITGDEVPPIEDSAFVVEVEGPTRSNVPP